MKFPNCSLNLDIESGVFSWMTTILFLPFCGALESFLDASCHRRQEDFTIRWSDCEWYWSSQVTTAIPIAGRWWATWSRSRQWMLADGESYGQEADCGTSTAGTMHGTPCWDTWQSGIFAWHSEWRPWTSTDEQEIFRNTNVWGSHWGQQEA